ncbi:hydroxyacid dehydrogenase [Lentisphaera profundi]|uniref:Hydroxyacid dehydrogenase n=1 Tax=Lentisphaera profundi TaxID=1658616 RepID=A0ABY7VYL6_9BACT|nr:hydroxyacid dehydrogenase [Lentisphaera profundi]WDE99366.1 hydroxyacid dehydrogenase [Lentisphaera profundi]
MKAAFFNNGNRLFDVYANGRKEIIEKEFELFPQIITSENFAENAELLKEVEVIFTTWGMPACTAEQVAKLPNLKLLMHAAGSTKSFAQPFLEAGVRVFCAAESNSIPVAEFCLAQILLASKGFFQNVLDTKRMRNNDHFGGAYKGKGAYGEKIAFISVGKITKHTMELLSPFHFDKLAVSRSLSASYCQENSISKVTMEEAFEQAYIISNHLPDRDDNIGVINYDLLSQMRYGATFINTGRGAQVNEDDLIRVMKERPDLCALLDVTHPEPSSPNSELFDLPNVHMSSHLAGSINDEYVRMADFVIEQVKNWQNNKELSGEVSLEELAYLA